MGKIIAGLVVASIAACALAFGLGGGTPTAAAPHDLAVLTAWRCPITDQIFTNPLTCKNACFGYTCQAIHQ